MLPPQLDSNSQHLQQVPTVQPSGNNVQNPTSKSKNTAKSSKSHKPKDSAMGNNNWKEGDHAGIPLLNTDFSALSSEFSFCAHFSCSYQFTKNHSRTCNHHPVLQREHGRTEVSHGTSQATDSYPRGGQGPHPDFREEACSAKDDGKQFSNGWE